jgi:hypothetical protein
VDLLVFKLLLTPLLIGGASLAGRRWGPAIGGWMVALPLISGPVALFLALDQGLAFGAAAARGSCAGNAALAVCFLAYARVSASRPWPLALATAIMGWAVVAIAIQPALAWPAAAVLAVVAAAVLLALRAMPPPTGAAHHGAVPRWEVPLRMVVGTTVVVVLTAAATVLGPGLSGLLAMLPVITLVLSVFTHRRDGAATVADFLRGDLAGLLGTAVFLAIVAGSLESLGIAASFGAATVAAVAIQGATVRLLRARVPPARAPAVPPAAGPASGSAGDGSVSA